MERIRQAVAKYAAVMLAAEKYIWKNPEVGYKEFKTNDYMIAEFEKLGYEVKRFEGITGFTATFDTGRAGATVLVLAELDALYCFQHPERNVETGAVHCCGHNAQCASILGVAGAIREQSVSGELSGKVKFGIVPAEEGVDISFRNELIEKGIIKFTSGKAECISRGLLDGVDISFMVHLKDMTGFGGTYSFEKGSNGVVRKKTVITGKAAHAGSVPHEGINALFAAELVLGATNALRETFKEEDFIRFHSIITKSGDSVNTVPEEVVMESYVRGASPKAIMTANKKLNRAITGACLAMGAKVRIIDRAGSEPMFNDENLVNLMLDIGARLAGKEKSVDLGKWMPASTDMGDVTCLVPAVHGYVDGARGVAHSKEYVIPDPLKTCTDSAVWQVGTIVELLKDNSKKAYEIKASYKPVYKTVEEYLVQKTALSQNVDCIEYDREKIYINL